MVVIDVLAVPDELAGAEELLELLHPETTADAIAIPAMQPDSASVRLICSFFFLWG
jgi:hypothetical protein